MLLSQYFVLRMATQFSIIENERNIHDLKFVDIIYIGYSGSLILAPLKQLKNHLLIVNFEECSF